VKHCKVGLVSAAALGVIARIGRSSRCYGCQQAEQGSLRGALCTREIKKNQYFRLHGGKGARGPTEGAQCALLTVSLCMGMACSVCCRAVFAQ